MSTSLNDVKVDWTWHKPHIKGKSHVYNWWESDHRPIGFTFDGVKGGGVSDNIGNKNIIIILIVLIMIIIILLLFVLFNDPHKKDKPVKI